MRIQDLAIIFIIIILPISIVLGAYTQMQISTISLQTEYDMKLIAATSDAIKAFQIKPPNIPHQTCLLYHFSNPPELGRTP